MVVTLPDLGRRTLRPSLKSHSHPVLELGTWHLRTAVTLGRLLGLKLSNGYSVEALCGPGRPPRTDVLSLSPRPPLQTALPNRHLTPAPRNPSSTRSLASPKRARTRSRPDKTPRLLRRTAAVRPRRNSSRRDKVRDHHHQKEGRRRRAACWRMRVSCRNGSGGIGTRRPRKRWMPSW